MRVFTCCTNNPLLELGSPARTVSVGSQLTFSTVVKATRSTSPGSPSQTASSVESYVQSSPDHLGYFFLLAPSWLPAGLLLQGHGHVHSLHPEQVYWRLEWWMTIYQILFVQTTKEQAKKLETNYKEVCSFICLVIRALSYFQSTALYCVSENNVLK